MKKLFALLGCFVGVSVQAVELTGQYDDRGALHICADTECNDIKKTYDVKSSLTSKIDKAGCYRGNICQLTATLNSKGDTIVSVSKVKVIKGSD